MSRYSKSLAWLLCSLGLALLLFSLVLTPSQTLFADDPGGGGGTLPLCEDVDSQCSKGGCPLRDPFIDGCPGGNCNQTIIHECKDCKCLEFNGQCFCKLN